MREIAGESFEQLNAKAATVFVIDSGIYEGHVEFRRNDKGIVKVGLFTNDDPETSMRGRVPEMGSTAMRGQKRAQELPSRGRADEV